MKKKVYREKYYGKKEKKSKKKIQNDISKDPVEIINNNPENNKIFAFKGLLDKSKKNNQDNSEKSDK